MNQAIRQTFSPLRLVPCALLAVVLGIAACTDSSTPPRGSELTSCQTEHASDPARRLVVSDLGIVGDAPTYIALEQGHFAAMGLDVELQRYRSAVDMIPSLGQGRLDAGTGSLSAGLFNGLAEGLDISVIADSATVAPGPDSHLSLVLAPGLEPEVTGYADLSGLRVAINAQAGGLEIELARALALGDLTLDDVELIYLPFPEMVAAFTMDLIDAAILPEPFLSTGLANETFVELAAVGEFYPHHQISVLMFSGGMAADESVATRYLCAYLLGIRDFRNAFIDRTYPPEEMIQAVMRHTPIEDPALFDLMRYHEVAANGAPNLESIESDLQYYRNAGYVEAEIDLDAFVDLHLVTEVDEWLDSE